MASKLRALVGRTAARAIRGQRVVTSLVSELVRGRPGVNRGDHGATATEYAILVSMIALVIVGAVTVFGQNVIGLFYVPSSVFTR